MIDKTIVKIKQNKDAKKRIHLSWVLFDHCNYNCIYCKPNGGSDDYTEHSNLLKADLGVVKKNIKHIFDLYKDPERSFFVSLSGGEGTLWSELPDFIKTLRSYGGSLGMSSNASAPIEFWEEFKHDFEWLVWSFHPETSNPNLYLKKLEKFHNWIPITARISMYPPKWEMCLDIAKEIRKLPIYSLEYVPLFKNFGTENAVLWDYTDEQLEFLKQHGGLEQQNNASFLRETGPTFLPEVEYSDGSFEPLNFGTFISEKHNYFNGWECSVGIEEIFINSMGDIFRGNCLQGGKIGNILEDGMRERITKPIICNYACCYCITDIMVSKHKKL